jgi:hypothetical protein
MKALFLAVALALPLPAAAPAGDALESIAANCKKRWGDDYAMQRYCRDRQMDAAQSATKMLDALKEAEGNPNADPKRVAAFRNIIRSCRDRWHDGDGFDWPMLVYCVDKQTKAFVDLESEDRLIDESRKPGKP